MGDIIQKKDIITLINFLKEEGIPYEYFLNSVYLYIKSLKELPYRTCSWKNSFEYRIKSNIDYDSPVACILNTAISWDLSKFLINWQILYEKACLKNI